MYCRFGRWEFEKGLKIRLYNYTMSNATQIVMEVHIKVTGRQCAFMGLSALLIRSSDVSQWTANTANQLSTKGDM